MKVESLADSSSGSASASGIKSASEAGAIWFAFDLWFCLVDLVNHLLSRDYKKIYSFCLLSFFFLHGSSPYALLKWWTFSPMSIKGEWGFPQGESPEMTLCFRIVHRMQSLRSILLLLWTTETRQDLHTCYSWSQNVTLLLCCTATIECRITTAIRIWAWNIPERGLCFWWF